MKYGVNSVNFLIIELYEMGEVLFNDFCWIYVDLVCAFVLGTWHLYQC